MDEEMQQSVIDLQEGLELLDDEVQELSERVDGIEIEGPLAELRQEMDSFAAKLSKTSNVPGPAGKSTVGPPGAPGRPGRTPTETELKALIKPLIPDPIPGRPGKDGETRILHEGGGNANRQIAVNGTPIQTYTDVNLIGSITSVPNNITKQNDITISGGGTPAAPDTAVQYNNAGAFGGADWLYTQPTVEDDVVVNFAPATRSGFGKEVYLNAGSTNDQTSSGGSLWLRSGAQLVGVVKTVSYVAIGDGYLEGDVVTLVGGDNNATVTIGAEGSLVLTTGGTGYTTNTTCAVTGGSGTGMTLRITTLGSQGSYIFVSHLHDIDIFGADSFDNSHSGSGIISRGGKGYQDRDGGNLNYTAGEGGATGQGGGVLFIGGDGGVTSGAGGAISFNAGSAQGADSNGGNVSLTPGTATGTGIAGHVILNNIPNSDPGIPGALYQVGGVLMISL